MRSTLVIMNSQTMYKFLDKYAQETFRTLTQKTDKAVTSAICMDDTGNVGMVPETEFE